MDIPRGIISMVYFSVASAWVFSESGAADWEQYTHRHRSQAAHPGSACAVLASLISSFYSMYYCITIIMVSLYCGGCIDKCSARLCIYER